jgi:phenylalanyl-tRNA synthetase alpha subunit
MDMNIKMLVDEMQKMWEGMHISFAAQETTVNKHLDDFALADQTREERVAVLESTTSEFDKAFTSWKPEVHTSLNFVKLELTKLNSYFDRDVRSTSNPKSRRTPVGIGDRTHFSMRRR